VLPSSRQDDALEERADVEICFSRSSEAKQLFSAVEQILGAKLKKEKVLEKRAIILDTCARGLLVALEAANDFRRRRTGMYPPSMGTGVNWTCELEAARRPSSVGVRLLCAP
jgi:nuclear pore complex protein Nup133